MLAAAVVALLAGCKGGVLVVVDGADQDAGADSNRVHGWIGGDPFVLDRAESTALLQGHDMVTIQLFDAGLSTAPCDEEGKWYAPPDYVSFRADLEEGAWKEDELPQPVAFAWIRGDSGTGDIAETATVSIDDVDLRWDSGEPSTLRGSLTAWADEETHVEGTFEALICYTDDSGWP